MPFFYTGIEEWMPGKNQTPRYGPKDPGPHHIPQLKYYISSFYLYGLDFDVICKLTCYAYLLLFVSMLTFPVKLKDRYLFKSNIQWNNAENRLFRCMWDFIESVKLTKF